MSEGMLLRSNSGRFERSARLLRPQEFKRVFEQPQRLSSRNLMVYARANGIGYARLGLAISKKAVPRAVDRNRIKRIARASFRLSTLRSRSWDIIVMCRNGGVLVDNPETHRALAEMWRRLEGKCADS